MDNLRFKFRVWFTPNYQEPEMIYDAEMTYDNRWQGKGSFYHESFGEILEDKDCVVMQCTGLKDKNGKLIYEGDVINIWCKNLTKNQISDVFYCEERAAFCFHYNTDFGNIVPCTMDKTEIEVIGNIYENKDLLND